jgi:predicted Fe-Mo cluster-binding NifX family protein
MKIAIPYWRGVVSPVFDFAATVLIVDIENGTEMARNKKALRYTEPLARVRYLLYLNTNILICGAISRQLEFTLQSSGVQVVSNICGPTDEVLSAFLKGTLNSRPFLMPGYVYRGRRGRNREYL